MEGHAIPSMPVGRPRMTKPLNATIAVRGRIAAQTRLGSNVAPLVRAIPIVLIAVLLGGCSGGSVTAGDVAVATTGRVAGTATAAPATSDPPPGSTPTPTQRWDELPAIATEPAALTEQLALIERIIRDPKASADQLAWAGHAQQLAYSRLADYPDWREPVLATLPAGVRAAVIGSLDAGRQLRSMNAPMPKSLPSWHIVAPASIDDLLRYYREAESTFGVPWYYLAAINLVETRMGRIRGDSSAGAQGPMQFIPSTWAVYGEGDVNSDHDAILAAGRYLKAAGAPGDMARAILAYNHDSRYVAAVTAYAEVMHADAAAFRGYYGWQVYFPTPNGPVLLPVGWKRE